MKKFLRSFVFAGEGIWKTVRTQRNFRFHIAAAVYVAAFSMFYDLSKTEYAILMLTFSSVIAAEMINTAVESAVDLYSAEFSRAAKTAKDAAAGAVLVTAVFAVIIGIILFLDINVIKNIFEYYSENIISLIGLIISVPISVCFISGKFFKDSERKEYGDKK